ncbi:hypothetical protein SVIOM342S_05105 [Streptomyces violaceorubidus]
MSIFSRSGLSRVAISLRLSICMVRMSSGEIFPPSLILDSMRSLIRSAARAVSPVLRQEVGVLRADDRLVGGDDVAALRVLLVRQLVVGDVPLPAVRGVPARRGHGAGALGAHGDLAGGLVADVLGVGVDQVLRGDLEVLGRGAELPEVLGPVDLEDRVHGLAGLQGGPLEGDGVAGAPVGGRVADGGLLADLLQLGGAVGDHGAVPGRADGDLTGATARDLDRLVRGGRGTAWSGRPRGTRCR